MNEGIGRGLAMHDEDNQFLENLIRLEPNAPEDTEDEKAFAEEESEEIPGLIDLGVDEEVDEDEEPPALLGKSLPAKATSAEEAGASSKKHPKITSIQAQKRKGRYNIYLNDKYAFPVDEALIIKHLLRKGMEVSPELQATLKAEDTFRKAYQRALNYLSYGLRSEKEVRDDLIEREFEEYTDEVIEKLKDQRLINDLEYAKAYVRTAANLNRKGPRVIARELKKRGIDELKIEEAMPEYQQEDLVYNAVFLAEKQWKKAKKKSQKEAVQKVRQFLMQKGFNKDTINIAIETIDTEKDDDEEYEALVVQGEKAWKRYARKTEGYELKQKTKAYLYTKGYPTELINRFLEAKEEELS